MTLSAAELYRRGRAHLNAGRNAAARRVLGLAAERADDPDLRARIAGSLAAVTIRQGDAALAERLCWDALGLPRLSTRTTAMLHGQLGLLALERGELDRAMEWLDRGIAGIGDEAEHRAPMLLNRSVVHLHAGRVAAGRADLELAARDYATTGNEVEKAMAVHNTGYAALLEGDLVQALDTMAEAHTVLAAASAVNAAICDLDRAQVLRDAGLVTEAERSLERVAHVFGVHRMRQARGETEYHLARSLLSHEAVRAAGVAAAARRRFQAVGSDGWALRADAVRLRALLRAGVADEAAAARMPSAAEVERVASALDARRLRSDATALRLMWELWRACPNGRGQAPTVPIRLPRDAPIPLVLLAHEVRSARAAAAGDLAAARRHAATGLDALAQWQASFGSLDLATSFVMHGRRLVFAGLRAAVRSGRPVDVFDWSERARHLSQQVVPLRPPPDAELAADLAELRRLRAEDGTGDWLSLPRAVEVSERVRRRQWSATGAAGRRERVTLEGLRAALPGDTAFATYVFDETGLAVLAVTGDAVRFQRIEAWERVAATMAGLRADLDIAASVRTGPMAALVGRTLQERLATLSAALVEPILPTIGDRRLVITVPGILGGIPWGMLPAMRGRVYAVATSATQWISGRSSRPAPGIGFVVGPRVPRADEEAARGLAAWGAGEVLGAERATVRRATELASRVGVLHVAAHGRHAADHPLFSGLELADGALFGYDIDLMPRVPDTVILSACEVGRSSVRWGEEAVGMTRIWLHAGTRCVIAAPVVVADDEACELLGAVHDRLAAGEPPSVALAAASARTGIVAPFQVHGAGF
ncbi:CHAT domain-containing protein [Microbacterium sp.]|uniref:CHAT domain-containing protein n=1 Tax=Microbacterium sp. TaxID=51671 RepID=UPI0039E3C0D7